MYSHYLDTFVCVADAGSFAKAAEKMFISATAIMKQVNQMEKQLGIQLFECTPRGLALTAAGKSYYRDAKFMIRYAQEAKERAQMSMRSEEIVIRVGVSALAPTGLLMELWPFIQQMARNMKLKVVHFENTEENVSDILKNLGTGIDVILTMHDDGIKKLRGCSGTELCQIPLMCAVPLYHPLAMKKRLTVSDLYDETLLLIREGWAHEMNRMRRDIYANHERIHIEDFNTYTIDVFNECAEHGKLLVTVDDWKNVHPQLKTLLVDWTYNMRLELVHAHEPSKSVKTFLRFVRQAYQEYIRERHQPEG